MTQAQLPTRVLSPPTAGAAPLFAQDSPLWLLLWRHAEVEQRYGVSIEERQARRADLSGPVFRGDMLQKHVDKEQGYEPTPQDCKLKHELVATKQSKGAEAA